MRFNTQSRKLFRQLHMNKPMGLPDIHTLSEKYEDMVLSEAVSIHGYKLVKIVKDEHNSNKEWHIFKDGKKYAWTQVVSKKVVGKELVDKKHIEDVLGIKL